VSDSGRVELVPLFPRRPVQAPSKSSSASHDARLREDSLAPVRACVVPAN
jgi:hypothetical protein